MTSPEGPIYKNQNTKFSKEIIPLLSKNEIENNFNDKRKNLMALTAGSYGKKYIQKIIEKFGHKDFDYLIFVYDDTTYNEKIFEKCEIIYEKKLKWEYAKKYLTKTKCEKYKYVFFWDEDIDVLDLDYKNVIRIMDINGLELAQPAMSDDSYYSWEIMKKHNSPIGRFTNFVECGPALIFSTNGLEKYLKIVDTKLNKWGWGYDIIAFEFGKIKRMGIIDCEVIKHTREITSIETSAPKEMYDLFKKYDKFEYDFITYNNLINFSKDIEEEFNKPSAWKGLETKVSPFLKNIKPVKRIVEIGVDYGYSLFHLAKMYPDAEIIGIDPFGWEDHLDAEKFVEKYLHKYPNIKLIKKTSTEARKIFDKKIDILHIDAEHTYNAVTEDFNLFAPLVRENGIVLFHDITSFPNDIGKFFEEIPNGTKNKIIENNGLGIWQKTKRKKAKIILAEWGKYDFNITKKFRELSFDCGLNSIFSGMKSYDAGMEFELILIVTECEEKKKEQYEKLKEQYPFIKEVFFRDNKGRDIGSYNFGYNYLKKQKYYGDIVFMNSGTRGPNRDNWLLEYSKLFNEQEKIGFCGVTLNSHNDNLLNAPFLPHVQSYFIYTKTNFNTSLI